jgi:hypothetical protein
MSRSRSSLSYDILHGIHFPANLSVMLAYLSYFPPPPPILPGPPSSRSWTCSSSPLSCFVSDDRNPPSLREYMTLNDYNQSELLKNTSPISITFPSSTQSSSLIDFFHQNQFLFILLSILLLILLLFLIIFLFFYLYYQRHRQRQLTSNNKNQKFYYRLIPRHQKHPTTQNNNEHQLVRLRKPPSTTQVIHIGGIHTKTNHETEEAV